jgi:hypothetical protein
MWIIIFGCGEREEFFIPAEAECRRRAMLAYELVDPRGQRRPAVISLPIEIIDGVSEAAAKALEMWRV